jgi:hypothetical protein
MFYFIPFLDVLAMIDKLCLSTPLLDDLLNTPILLPIYAHSAAILFVLWVAWQHFPATLGRARAVRPSYLSTHRQTHEDVQELPQSRVQGHCTVGTVH